MTCSASVHRVVIWLARCSSFNWGSGGFALHEVLGARVAGVSEVRVVQKPRLMRVSYGVAAKVLVPLWCYTISGALHPFRAGAMLSKWCNAP